MECCWSASRRIGCQWRRGTFCFEAMVGQSDRPLDVASAERWPRQRGAAELRDRLLEAARDNVALELEVSGDVRGSRFRVDVAISRQGKRAAVRSISLIRAGEFEPHGS